MMEITEKMEFSASEIHKVTKRIKTKLINSRKCRIEFHRSYPQYPNKISIYKSFSNITDAHTKLPQVDPSHLET